MAYQERNSSAHYTGHGQTISPLVSTTTGVSIELIGVARDGQTCGVGKKSEQEKLLPSIAAANTIIGGNVHNLQNEYLGNIKELMLNMQTGKIAYALLSFGDRFSMREKFFAMPWSAMMWDPMSKRLVLDIDKSRLKNAPGFDWKNWPDMSDESWFEDIQLGYQV